jgi:hypothetical protein
MIDLEGHAMDNIINRMRDFGCASLPAFSSVVEGQPMAEQKDRRDGAQVARIHTPVTAKLRPV